MVSPAFNSRMKIKIAVAICIATSLWAAVVFAQTLQITGTVTAVTSTQITLQSGSDSWTIKRSASTSVTSGSLTVGSNVTVKCSSPDAHKNEGANGAPTATPAS